MCDVSQTERKFRMAEDGRPTTREDPALSTILLCGRGHIRTLVDHTATDKRRNSKSEEVGTDVHMSCHTSIPFGGY